jgi:hypothetical protein
VVAGVVISVLLSCVGRFQGHVERIVKRERRARGPNAQSLLDIGIRADDAERASVQLRSSMHITQCLPGLVTRDFRFGKVAGRPGSIAIGQSTPGCSTRAGSAA